MATSITNTTVLDQFSTIRDILRSNSTISKRFKKADFYEFEPALASVSFDMLPYIVINVPKTTTEFENMAHTTTTKSFETTIVLVMSWDARSTSTEDGGNFRLFADAIIKTIEGAEDTLAAIGYQNAKIDLTDTSVDIIQGKKAVAGIFTLSTEGYSTR